MNTITLVGRLAKDIELKATSTGKNYCGFTLAVDRKFKDANGQRQTDFFDCIAWNKTAEFLNTYAHKGDRIGASGSLQSRKWEDQNGNKRTAYEIIVEQAELYNQPTGQEEKPAEAQPAQEQPQGELPFEI
jgi:single-strand DNA-binding protein